MMPFLRVNLHSKALRLSRLLWNLQNINSRGIIKIKKNSSLEPGFRTLGSRNPRSCLRNQNQPLPGLLGRTQRKKSSHFSGDPSETEIKFKGVFQSFQGGRGLRISSVVEVQNKMGRKKAVN
ncbi:hypothetical protein AVEN_104125-1 [Araneus ventricosus]|uniref:Uncharacterized protein n=1 Tax=Araneus ventricosus TaxID=182803 RepID=A0A4Y2D4S0_ARAVE|nr:hypothetical protein AVEN_104125-1 [Araneus ventricosus]